MTVNVLFSALLLLNISEKWFCWLKSFKPPQIWLSESQISLNLKTWLVSVDVVIAGTQDWWCWWQCISIWYADIFSSIWADLISILSEIRNRWETCSATLLYLCWPLILFYLVRVSAHLRAATCPIVLPWLRTEDTPTSTSPVTCSHTQTGQSGCFKSHEIHLITFTSIFQEEDFKKFLCKKS